ELTSFMFVPLFSFCRCSLCKEPASEHAAGTCQPPTSKLDHQTPCTWRGATTHRVYGRCVSAARRPLRATARLEFANYLVVRGRLLRSLQARFESCFER